MPFETILTRAFEKQLTEIIAKYPRSEDHVRRTISVIAGNPTKGDLYPGFGGMVVRKVRIGLPEYGMSQSRGLRLIALWLVEESKFMPLVVYRKGDYAAEHVVQKNIKRALNEILTNLPNNIS